MAESSAGALTGQSRVVINVLTSWGSYFVFFIAGFLLPHFIDDNLGKEMLGIWDFAWSLVNYLALSSMGIASSLNRFVASHRAAGEHDKVREAASTVFVIQCVLASLVLAASCIIALVMPGLIGQEGDDLVMAQWVFFLLGASLAMQFLFDTSRGILTGCHRWDIHSLLNAGTYFLAVIAMLVLLVAGYSLVALGAVYLTMHLVQGIIRHFIAMRICPESSFAVSSVSMSFARTILVFGGKSILLMISPVIIVQTTYFLVMTSLGPAVLAVLARPMSLMRHIESFLARFTNMLIPMAGSIGATQGQEELRRFALLSARFGFAFTFPVIGAFCVYGHEIVRIWMGDDYVDRAIIIALGLGYLLPLAQTAIVRVLTGINEHGRASIVAVVGTLVTYAITWVFVSGSTTPAAWAWLVVVPLALVNGIIVPVYACRRIGLGLGRYLREGFLAVTLCAGTTTLLLWAIDEGLELHGLWILPNLALYGLLTSMLYWKFVLTASMREGFVREVKKRVLGIAVRTGVMTRLLAGYRDTIPVLTVHGVADTAENDDWTPSWGRVSSHQLDAVMAVLSRHFEFVSVDEMVDMISGKKPLRPGCMAITFDDGYENNLSVALPVLERYGAPLNVFISTRMLTEREPYWIDRLDFALTQLPERRFLFKTDRITWELNWEGDENLEQAYRAFRSALHEAYDDDYELLEDLERVALELEARIGRSLRDQFEDDKWGAVISEDQLRDLPENVIVGSHTINHIRAGHIDAGALREELEGSKHAIERIAGRCDHFCYPRGVYNDEAARLAKSCGYVSAFTGDNGTNRVGDDAFKLKRISFPQGTSEGEVLYHLLRNLS